MLAGAAGSLLRCGDARVLCVDAGEDRLYLGDFVLIDRADFGHELLYEPVQEPLVPSTLSNGKHELANVAIRFGPQSSRAATNEGDFCHEVKIIPSKNG